MNFARFWESIARIAYFCEFDVGLAALLGAAFAEVEE